MGVGASIYVLFRDTILHISLFVKSFHMSYRLSDNSISDFYHNAPMVFRANCKTRFRLEYGLLRTLRPHLTIPRGAGLLAGL